jgi:hypothetical protein
MKPGDNISVSVTAQRAAHDGPPGTPALSHTLTLGTSSGNPRFHAWEAHQLLLRLAWEAASQLGDPEDSPTTASAWQRPDTSQTARVRGKWATVVGALQDVDQDAGNALSNCTVLNATTSQDGGVLVLRAAHHVEREVRRAAGPNGGAGGGALTTVLNRCVPLPANRGWTVSWSD